jgi:hypothetical protein
MRVIVAATTARAQTTDSQVSGSIEYGSPEANSKSGRRIFNAAAFLMNWSLCLRNLLNSSSRQHVWLEMKW